MSDFLFITIVALVSFVIFTAFGIIITLLQHLYDKAQYIKRDRGPW